MCGAAASLTMDVQPALDAMKHRGVRSQAVKATAGWDAHVGHVRLPIVGLGTEYDQPRMIGPWVFAFVGEILNFRNIKPGMQCDVELVGDTWYNHGPDGFHKFDGFWHVIAVDQRDGALHILTDYLAQKPVYYREDSYSAASELDAVAKLGPPVTPDRIYFSSVIKWGYCPETWRTPYQEVKRVLPGEHVIMRQGQPPEIQCVDPIRSWGLMDHEFRQLFEEAVRRRVTSSDVPVAALVSGGLDSSIVWHLATRYGDVKPFYVDDGNVVWVPNGTTKLSHEDVKIDKAIQYMQEPVDLGSLIPQIALSDAVGAQGINVCLTGDGADELFGGYGRATRYDSQASDVCHELVAWHLPRLDAVMMRNRVEVRSPFLSRHIVNAALALPWSKRQNKCYLREMFKDVCKTDVPKVPLRTPMVEQGREAWTLLLVEEFMKRFA